MLEQMLLPAAHHSFRIPVQPAPANPPAPQNPHHRKPALSAREIEVMIAWFAADSKTVAARSVYISEGTINTHITRIRQKYAAVGRSAPTKAALFARALQDGHTHLSEW
ncbi:MAG: LuxR C-terminal-related transcriptional regulator [Rhodococcus sp. (in: high G+C Gram-positive bacteria)]|uniref:LuxR C-terminal-related transcriptional regulator n=1 Tax=Rhodococcus sp. TaxID=1831 RepID=UPI002AD8B3A6|nr:LuxR C-terminal-related transcriptional regulator [Rhodococcus sp. (in: high G+C Gram-positive bacteria)]